MGLSHNKVAVLEGAAGSPPFQGELMLVEYFFWFDTASHPKRSELRLS